MQVKSFLGGFDKNFSYLIWCNDTKEAAIIDPAVEIPSIPKSNPKIKAIVKNTKGFLLKFSTEYIIVIYL